MQGDGEQEEADYQAECDAEADAEGEAEYEQNESERMEAEVNNLAMAENDAKMLALKQLHDEKLTVHKAMKKYGGSFVSSLAECILQADDINLEKIRNTFHEYWNQYLEMGKKEE